MEPPGLLNLTIRNFPFTHPPVPGRSPLLQSHWRLHLQSELAVHQQSDPMTCPRQALPIALTLPPQSWHSGTSLAWKRRYNVFSLWWPWEQYLGVALLFSLASSLLIPSLCLSTSLYTAWRVLGVKQSKCRTKKRIQLHYTTAYSLAHLSSVNIGIYISWA